MRVLFTSTHGRGHVQPMLPLAHALREAGHDVRWACSEIACVRLREKGFDAVRAGLAEAGMPPPPAEVASLPPRDRPDFMFAKIFGAHRVEPMLDDLVPLVDDWHPALLICEQAELAGPIAAAHAGIPNVTHAFGRLLPSVRLVRATDELANVWRANGLEPRAYAGTYEHLYIDIYPPSLQSRDIEHVGQIQLVRPAPVLEGSTGAEPVIYITFGTVFNKDHELFTVATEAARELPARVVVTLGNGLDPESLGDQPPNVRVAEFIPQEDLLPECAAVISHAGSGTFLGALAAGVPQVLLPQAADQFGNAEAGADGGVGIALWPGEVSVGSIRKALVRVLEEESMRAASERVRNEIAAMPTPDEVVDELIQRYG